jgi:hypothetical protein
VGGLLAGDSFYFFFFGAPFFAVFGGSGCGFNSFFAVFAAVLGGSGCGFNSVLDDLLAAFFFAMWEFLATDRGKRGTNY